MCGDYIGQVTSCQVSSCILGSLLCSGSSPLISSGLCSRFSLAGFRGTISLWQDALSAKCSHELNSRAKGIHAQKTSNKLGQVTGSPTWGGDYYILRIAIAGNSPIDPEESAGIGKRASDCSWLLQLLHTEAQSQS